MTEKQDPPADGEQVVRLSGPLGCLCEWRLLDTGSIFRDVRGRPHPDCPVHRGK